MEGIHQKIEQMGLADDLQQLLNLQKSVDEAYNAVVSMLDFAGSGKVTGLIGGKQASVPGALDDGLLNVGPPTVIKPQYTPSPANMHDPFSNTPYYV